MKQFTTLSLEYLVCLSVETMNKNTKKKVPNNSETVAEIHFEPKSVTTASGVVGPWNVKVWLLPSVLLMNVTDVKFLCPIGTGYAIP